MRLTARPSRKAHSQYRTRPVKGTGEDKGKWFRCGNCGFICNVDRDSLGDSQTMSRVGMLEFTPSTYPTEGGLSAISVLGGTGNSHVSLELGADQQTIADTLDDEVSITGVLDGSTLVSAPPETVDGIATTIRYYFKPIITGGCPFCGTRNWRGDY